MKLNKVFMFAVCFGVGLVMSGCGNAKAEKERIAAEQAAEAERIADETAARAKAQAEEEARKAAEKAAEDEERKRRFDELSSMSLKEIVENNDLYFSIDEDVDLYKENGRWYCKSSVSTKSPVYLADEIENNILNVYISSETAEKSYEKDENGINFNHPFYINYGFYKTLKFSITKNQLIEYMTDKDYKLPEVLDCDVYDDSIQYFNPVNNIKAVVIADYANVRDDPRGVGDINNVAVLSQWDEVKLLGRAELTASLDGTKEEPFYLINVKNEKGETVPGWIHGSLIKIFRDDYRSDISDLERLKLYFSEVDSPVLVPDVEYSGRKVLVQGKLLSYYGYDENNPIIDSIDSFLNYYTDSELLGVKEFYLSFAEPEMGLINPVLVERGYGELPSLEGIERIPDLEKLYLDNSVHVKSLAGLDKLKNLKVMNINCESLSDEDKALLEPFKTDKEGEFYFKGYNGKDEKKLESSDETAEFLCKYNNSAWISSFDGNKKDRKLSFGTVSLPDSCHYLIFETENDENYLYYGLSEGGHVFDHFMGHITGVKKISDSIFEISVNFAENMSDLVTDFFVDNIHNAIFSDKTEIITVSDKILGTEKGIVLKFNSLDIAGNDFYKYDKSKFDSIYYNSFTTENNVYVKNGIAKDDKIMTVINKDEKIHILSKSDTTSVLGDVEDFWYMVELRNGVIGFIFGAYISNGDKAESDSEIINIL